MKKYILYLMAIIVIISTIGCGSTKLELTSEDYNLSDNTTSKGITIGSSSDDFMNAYNGYIVDVWYADDNSNTAKEIKVNEVDYTKQSHIGLHTFFIDDKAINVNSFKKKNNIDSDLNSWFENNTEYLQKHSVVYKCLVFTFDNGIVNNIKYSEKNFNE